MTDARWAKLNQLAEAVNPPSGLSAAALVARFGERRHWDVRAGQLWRAASPAGTTVVLITRVLEGVVTAAPVTVGLDEALPGSAVVAVPASAFAVPVVVWLPLAREFAWAALDQLLDDWEGTGVVEWLADPTATTPPQGCKLTRVQQPFLEEPFEARDTAQAALDDVAETYPPLVDDQAVGNDTPDLLDGVKPSALAEILQVPVATAAKILRHQQELTSGQVRLLRDVLGSQAPVKVASQAPLSALAEAQHPRWRNDVARLASLRRWSVDEAYDHLARQATALAARATGPSQARWRARVQAVLDRELPGVTQ